MILLIDWSYQGRDMKSHKWWHSITRGDKYYTNHCLSGMGISFAIWPWIRMVVVNKMFEQMQIFHVLYRRSQYLDENAFHSLLKIFNENTLPNGNDKFLISFLTQVNMFTPKYLHKGQILSKLSWIFIGKRHFYPDKKENEKKVYTQRKKSLIVQPGIFCLKAWLPNQIAYRSTTNICFWN